MSRHVEDIKNMLFDEPDFDDNSDDGDDKARSKKSQSKSSKQSSTVETIVFRDPAKKKKQTKTSNTTNANVQEKVDDEFDLEKARFDVHKFGIKGFEKSKYEDARVELAIRLGAKPPKRKFINYRELIEQNRAKKAKENEEEENARLLGDMFHRVPNKNTKHSKRSKQKRIGEGDVGSMRFSSVGKFQGGVLKLNEKDISKVKNKSASSNNKRKRLGKSSFK